MSAPLGVSGGVLLSVGLLADGASPLSVVLCRLHREGPKKPRSGSHRRGFLETGLLLLRSDPRRYVASYAYYAYYDRYRNGQRCQRRWRQQEQKQCRFGGSCSKGTKVTVRRISEIER